MDILLLYAWVDTPYSLQGSYHSVCTMQWYTMCLPFISSKPHIKQMYLGGVGHVWQKRLMRKSVLRLMRYEVNRSLWTELPARRV